MREARRQAADHGQAIRAAHRFFHAPELGEVLEDDDPPGGAVLVEPSHRPAQRPLPAVRSGDDRFVALPARGNGCLERDGKRRQLRAQGLAAQSRIGGAEDLLARRVEVGDETTLVHGDDSAGDGLDHGGEGRFQGGEALFLLAQLGASSL